MEARTYIRLHDGMPDHPKIDGLSDKAFRLLVDTWCWCSRHLTDGAVKRSAWNKRSTLRARKELITAGLAEVLPSGDIQMHDYLEWQRSAEEVQEIREAKGKAGAEGNHIRWHLKRGVKVAGCEFCSPPRDAPEPSHNPSHMRSQTDRKPIANASQTDPIVIGIDIDRLKEPPVIPSGTPPTRAPTRRPTDDDDQIDQIDQTTIKQLRELVGVTVSRKWARRVRADILAGRTPDSPAKYVAAAIRKNPVRYLPQASRDRSSRTVAEAIAESLGDGDPAPGDDP